MRLFVISDGDVMTHRLNVKAVKQDSIALGLKRMVKMNEKENSIRRS